MHGLALERSVRLLAGSTRFTCIASPSCTVGHPSLSLSLFWAIDGTRLFSVVYLLCVARRVAFPTTRTHTHPPDPHHRYHLASFIPREFWGLRIDDAGCAVAGRWSVARLVVVQCDPQALDFWTLRCRSLSLSLSLAVSRCGILDARHHNGMGRGHTRRSIDPDTHTRAPGTGQGESRRKFRYSVRFAISALSSLPPLIRAVCVWSIGSNASLLLAAWGGRETGRVSAPPPRLSTLPSHGIACACPEMGQALYYSHSRMMMGALVHSPHQPQNTDDGRFAADGIRSPTGGSDD